MKQQQKKKTRARNQVFLLCLRFNVVERIWKIKKKVDKANFITERKFSFKIKSINH